MFKRIARLFIIVIILCAVGTGVSIYIAATKWRSKAPSEVEISPGMSVRAIAMRLKENGVVGTPRLFEVVARLKGAGGRLKAGTYDFPQGTSLFAALEKIESGDVRRYPFTIIEGWTIADIADALSKGSFAAGSDIPDRVRLITHDPVFITQMGFEGVNSLEGYLFPDTYMFTKPISAEVIVRQLVSRFREVWAELKGASESEMDGHQIVTLASIIEKETGVAGERPIVASVFMNRLKAGMPMQSDPTIIYGLPRFDGNIRREDITNPHPYNTYVHPGLPPGPICNPGRASLEAALHPAKTKYFYFVSKNDGTHLFTSTIAEHAQAVERYQK